MTRLTNLRAEDPLQARLLGLDLVPAFRGLTSATISRRVRWLLVWATGAAHRLKGF